jgi:hypothetical protein
MSISAASQQMIRFSLFSLDVSSKTDEIKMALVKVRRATDTLRAS